MNDILNSNLNELENVAKKNEESLQNQLEVFKTLSNTDSSALINAAHNQKIMTAMQDPLIDKKLTEGAKDYIENKVEAKVAEGKKENQDAKYDLRKEACENYGKNASCPMWQQNMMVIGDAFWFLFYWIVASVTICPIMIFSKGIKGVIKISWLSWILAAIIYLLIAVAIPLILGLKN